MKGSLSGRASLSRAGCSLDTRAMLRWFWVISWISFFFLPTCAVGGGFEGLGRRALGPSQAEALVCLGFGFRA